MRSGNKQFRQKCLCSLIIILIYLVGQNIPAPWVLVKPVTDPADGIFENIRSIIGSSGRIISLFHMGIMPWMTSSILLQLFNFSRAKKKRMANSDIKALTHVMAVIFCAVMMWMQSGDLQYASLLGNSLLATRVVLTGIITLGTVAVIAMAERNTEKGMGGISLFILVNILRGMESLVPAFGQFGRKTWFFVAMALVTAVVIVWMEDAEFRCPSQKIMIYNDMAENGHFALKFAPIGIQPLMYVMGFYMVPYFILRILRVAFPHNGVVAAMLTGMNYSRPSGLVLFCLCFAFVTAALIAVYVNPEEIADEMRRNGECLVGIRPGKDTEAFVKRKLVVMGTTSTAIIAVMASAPLLLGGIWSLDTRLSSLPMNAMILAGIIKMLRQEIAAMRVLDRYKEVF